MSGKVLITGGFGNLGSWITLYLAGEGYELVILTRKENKKFEDINYRVIECDITNLKELKNKLNEKFDYCIHMASFNEFFLDNYAQKALNINTLGTRNLLEVLDKKELKNFIYFSTFHVYGINNGIVTEESSLSPKNDYASTHLFSEYYIKQFEDTDNLKYTILRLTNSYGKPYFIDSDKWYLVLNDLSRMAYKSGKLILHGNGKALRDYIYMGDVCFIIKSLLIHKATNDIYNVSSGKTYKVMDIALKIKKIYDQKYNKTIEIKINENDKTVHNKLLVSNTKLKCLIPFNNYEMFEKEINNIFDCLEKNEFN